MSSNETQSPDVPPICDAAPTGWYHTWRYFFWFLVLVAVGLGFYAVENWRGRWAWSKYQAGLRARGEPSQAGDCIPPRVPDDENFAMTPTLAPLLDIIPGSGHLRDPNAVKNAQAFSAAYDAASREIKSVKGPRSNSWLRPGTDLALWQTAFMKAGGADQEETGLSATNTGPNAAAAVLAALAEGDAVLAEIAEASQRPHCRFNIHYDEDCPATILLPHLAILKHFSQVLQLRACAELAAGKTDRAFKDVMLMLYLADAVKSEPILISQLVRIAQVNLALQPVAEGLGQWSDAQLQALQERLQHFDLCMDMRRVLQSEGLLFGAGVIDYVRRSPTKWSILESMGDDSQRHGSSVEGIIFTVAPSGWFSLETLNLNRLISEDIAPTIDLVSHQVSPVRSRKAEERIEALALHAPPALVLRHQFFSRMLVSGIPRAAQRMAFAQTGVEAASVACALERYRRAKGQFPDSLNSLVPQFATLLPHDLITGQPLKYQRTDGGQYLFYSVGWNEKDDGGTVALSKSGESVDSLEGDWVWRPLAKEQ